MIVWESLSGPEGLAIFCAAFVLATVLLLPSTPGSLAAGWLYGLLPGVVLVIAVSVLADAITFLIARRVGRARVERFLAKAPRLRVFDEALSSDGFRTVVLLRLSPLAPYNVLNYLFGVTSVSLRDYLTGSAVGSLPGTLLFVGIGVVLRDTGAPADGTPPETWQTAAMLATVALTLLASLGLAQLGRRRLARLKESAS